MAISKFRLDFVGFRDDFILENCVNKKVAHFGAGDYPFTENKIKNGLLLHEKIDQVASSTCGFEYESESIDILCGHGFSVKFCDVTNPEVMSDVGLKEFDTIIFGEIIEHLSDPGGALRNIFSGMSSSATVVITTPNAFFGQNYINALFGCENVHPDHLLTFTPLTLSKLIVDSGGEILGGYTSFLNRISLKPSSRIWYQLSKKFPAIGETLIYHAKRSS